VPSCFIAFAFTVLHAFVQFVETLPAFPRQRFVNRFFVFVETDGNRTLDLMAQIFQSAFENRAFESVLMAAIPQPMSTPTLPESPRLSSQ
jgi:hypothetical protein